MAKSRARKLADIIVGAGIDIDGNLTFDGGSTSADLTFADGDKANFGDASDLQIFHNGSHSFIKDAGTGDLYIGASNNLALMNADFSENYILATTDGAVNLYYDGSAKFATDAQGVNVTGNADISGNMNLLDNGRAHFGNSNDLAIFHDASNSHITSGTGQFFLSSSNSNIWLRGGEGGILNSDGSEYLIRATSNGSVKLYHDNSIKVETFSGGVSVTGQLNATTMHLVDGSTGLQLGNSNDTKFFHDGSNSKITHSGSGGFYIGADTLGLQTGAHNENYLTAAANGAVSLYYDNSAKLATTSTGIDVTGSVTASTSMRVSDGEAYGFGDNSYRIEGKDDGANARIGFITGSSERMRLTSSGNVGIGTTSPNNKLEIQHSTVGTGNGSNNTLALRYNSTTLYGQHYMDANGIYHILADASGVAGGNMQLDADTTIRFATGSTPTERMRIDSSGNLVFNGSANITSNTSDGADNSQIIITGGGSTTSADTRGASIHLAGNENGNGGLLQLRGGSGSVGGIRFYSGGTERMRLTPAGNVGIGTTNPSRRLQVGSAGAGDIVGIRGASYNQVNIAHTSNTSWGMLLTNSDSTSNSGYHYSSSGNNNSCAIVNVNTDALHFGTDNAARMTIDHTGKVGIGTASPANTLQIGSVGSSGYGGNDFVIGDGTRVFATYLNSTSDAIEFYTNKNYAFLASGGTGNVGIGTASPTGAKLHVAGAIKGTDLIAHDSTGINLQTDEGTKRLVVTDAGNIGIGTTSPGQKLDVRGGSGGGTLTHAVFTGTTNRGAEIRTRSDISGGQHSGCAEFNSADSEGDGGDIALSSNGNVRMFVHGAGNVGIGTANPFARLQVADSELFMHGGTTTTGPGIFLGDNNFANSSYYNSAPGIGAVGPYGGVSAGLALYVYGSQANSRNEAMRIDNTGKVGIGTTNPGYKLDVAGTTNITSTDSMLLTLNPTANNYGGISFKYGGVTKGASIFNSGMMVYGGESEVSTALQAGGQYGLFIHHSTRWVGIGMSNATPTSVLNVRGDGGTSGLTFKTEDASANETFFVQDGGGVGVRYYPFTVGIPSSTSAASNGVFQVEEAGHLFVNTSGNVGIGTTSPAETLHIGSGQSNYIRIHNAASGDVASGITITRGSSTGFALYDNPSDDTTTFNAIGKMNFRTDGSSYRLYIGDNGRVGINTSGLSADGLIIGTNNGNCELDLINTGTNGTRWRFNSTSSGDLRVENKTDSTIPFVIEDTGNVGIGTTNPSSNGIFSVSCNLSAAFMGHFSNVNGSGYGLGLNTSSGNAVFFYHSFSNVGSITTTSTYTSYATTSDVRLKENIVDAPSASEDIDAIQVRSFDWKADGSHQKYGMVAQELAEVLPSAVNVPEEEDRMQSVDYSKLVPMLVKEVQSLRARVAELEGEK